MPERKEGATRGDKVTITTHGLTVTVAPRDLSRGNDNDKVVARPSAIEKKTKIMPPDSLPILMLMAKNAFPESYGVGDADYSLNKWEKRARTKGRIVAGDDYRRVCTNLRKNNWTLHDVAGVILDNVHSTTASRALGTMTEDNYKAKLSLIMAEIAPFWNPAPKKKKR